MVKWIKITTDIFDDEKIKIIDTMPARDEVLVIWFKILALAGKTNQSGMLFMNNKIAYTPEMLAAVFNRELSVIQLALTTFEQFGMIQVEENQVITVSNWEKHQNVDGLDKIREQNRLRQQKHREKQKLLLECNVTDNVTITEDNAPEEEVEEEKESIYRKFKHLSLTIIEKDRIVKDGYSINQLDEILDSIENYSKNKNYSSLNLTARKWLKKEYGKPNKKEDVFNEHGVIVDHA